MMPALAVLVAWLLFGGSHLLLSASPLRASLCKRFGTAGFVVIFATTAAVTMCLLIGAVAVYGDKGFPGPDFARIPAARWVLATIAFLGAALASAGIVNYPRSPMAVLARQWRATDSAGKRPLPSKSAVEFITHHPFFTGIALLMGSHALLASTLAQSVFFSGFVVLAVVGMPLQDRKLRERHGSVYEAYLADTDGDFRKRLRLQLSAGIGGAAVLLLAHPVWTFGHGAAFTGVALAGGLYGVARQLRRGAPA